MKRMLLGLLIGIFLLSACGTTINAPQMTSTPTKTPPLIPTAIKTTTPTYTPKPTETFTPTPTETPGPYWQLGNFGEYIHAVNDNGQETFNFLTPLEQWPRTTDIKPSTIEAIHRAYESIILSDGTPLVKPMTGPEYENLPPLNWRITTSKYGDSLWIGNDNTGDQNNPRAKILGSITFHFNGTLEHPYQQDYVLITMQVEDKSNTETGYALWTGITLKQHVTGMASDRLIGLFNNKLQLIPFIRLDQDATDDQFANMFRMLMSENSQNPDLTIQSFTDFRNGKFNRYADSHLFVISIGGTHWTPPNNP